jgi:hypothetical protein
MRNLCRGFNKTALLAVHDKRKKLKAVVVAHSYFPLNGGFLVDIWLFM